MNEAGLINPSLLDLCNFSAPSGELFITTFFCVCIKLLLALSGELFLLIVGKGVRKRLWEYFF
jgi:hypothetical protein